MKIFAYNPATGELISTDTVADWMGSTNVPPPDFDQVAAGCFWRGDHWDVVPAQPATPPVPQSVTRFQALAALDGARLLDDIEAYMQLESTPRIIRLAWENALSFERNSPALLYLAQVFELSEAQLDALFIAAAAIAA